MSLPVKALVPIFCFLCLLLYVTLLITLFPGHLLCSLCGPPRCALRHRTSRQQVGLLCSVLILFRHVMHAAIIGRDNNGVNGGIFCVDCVDCVDVVRHHHGSVFNGVDGAFVWIVWTL